MSKTHLGMFTIIAIAVLMVVSVQYSEAAKDSKTVSEIKDERNWVNVQTGPSSICGESSTSTIKNGYFIWALYGDGHERLDEESVKDHYNANDELIGSQIITIHDEITEDEDGKMKSHGMMKIKCHNGEKNTNEPYVMIVHKNGKITEN